MHLIRLLLTATIAFIVTILPYSTWAAEITQQQAVRETLSWASGSDNNQYLDELYDRIERAAYRHRIIPEFGLAVIAAEARYGQKISWARYDSWRIVEETTGVSRKPYRSVLDDLDTALSELHLIMSDSKNLTEVLERYWCGDDGQFNTDTKDVYLEAASKLWNALEPFAAARKANEDRNKYSPGYHSVDDSQPAWAGLAYGDLSGYASKLNSMPELAEQLEAFPDVEASYAQVAKRFNKKLTDEQAIVIVRAVLTYCKQTDWDVDPRLIMAIVSAESSFRPDAVSKVGAIGLGQLMPATAKSYGIKDPFDPIQNLYGCVKYIEKEMYRWKGDIDRVIASYNAGAGAVQKYGGVPPYDETQSFVKIVKRRYTQLKKE